MNPINLVVDLLERNLGMLNMTLADFSDADMLVRPAPAANHTTWQLGHLCASECRMMAAVKPDLTPVIPPDIAERFTRETAGVDDPERLLPRAALIDLFTKVRAATTAVVKGLSQEDLDREIPSPFKKGAMTTIGFMIHMPALHASMHLGQMQVVRRKLGKPVLF